MSSLLVQLDSEDTLSVAPFHTCMHYLIKETYNLSKDTYNLSKDTYNLRKEAYNTI